MSFDSTCRRLAEKFPEDFASWLLGRPIASTILQPTELSLEPIRADNVMLFEGESDILHMEWQTDPKQVVPARLADYRLRLHRYAPGKTIHQVVIYLRKTDSPRVYQDYFEIPGMYAEYRVIRIWEVPVEELMRYPGLWPFAALGDTDSPERSLRRAVRKMNWIKDIEQQHEVLGAAYLLSGLVLDTKTISKIIRRDVMRESVTYQAVLEEGREEGLEKGREEGRKEGREEGDRARGRQAALSLLRAGVPIDLIVEASGLSIAEITQLQQEQHP
jgi:predicted transposase/invertase (TIGR01784 family)